MEPRWTSTAKEGVGTAYHTSCQLWFTLSHGIVNEPNTRDLEFLITGGETFYHEEKKELHRHDWQISVVENHVRRVKRRGAHER